MTFIAPTGLTMAFMTALFRFSGLAGLPFLPLYGWVGLWTSAMLMATASGGLGGLIRHATAFTDDVFNGLLVHAPAFLLRMYLEVLSRTFILLYSLSSSFFVAAVAPFLLSWL